MNFNQNANVLIVDDVRANLVTLSEMVKSMGFIARPVMSVKQAMQAIDVCLPHLILLDVTMPEIDGFEFCAMLKKDIRLRDVPVIFITALTSTEDKIKGFELGAVDFIIKPFERTEVTMRINTHLKTYRMQQELEQYNKRLHKLINEQMYKVAEEKKRIFRTMAKMAESREDPTGKHIASVSKNSKIIAMGLQLSAKYEHEVTNDFIDNIELAAALHDIGKTIISDRILLKPGRLTEEEFEVIKKHTEAGAEILAQIYEPNTQNDMLRMAMDIARYHHEKWNGTGYPEGLKGSRIPLAARIVAIADVYDTLTGERCYKNAYSHEDSMEILLNDSGECFDPGIMEVVEKIQKQLKN